MEKLSKLTSELRKHISRCNQIVEELESMEHDTFLERNGLQDTTLFDSSHERPFERIENASEAISEIENYLLCAGSNEIAPVDTEPLDQKKLKRDAPAKEKVDDSGKMPSKRFAGVKCHKGTFSDSLKSDPYLTPQAQDIPKTFTAKGVPEN
ncbi:hypothetical protein DSO57_1005522 [Entomophthora muscae]|uniref:Uncharacterized protein n=1 Tax=Entomophthora muscae TaxID=34485 RepID=A0ACC2SXM6_9FUNG|nr:hypothetical protein DSO57_1005522 [Entomophthora muscae]